MKCFVYYSVTLPNWIPATRGLRHTFIHIHTVIIQSIWLCAHTVGWMISLQIHLPGREANSCPKSASHPC